MELKESEVTILNDAMYRVDNWYWRKWINLLFVVATFVWAYWVESNGEQSGIVCFAPLVGVYLRDVLVNWKGLKVQGLLLKLSGEAKFEVK
jgi:hypothetical protein